MEYLLFNTTNVVKVFSLPFTVDKTIGLLYINKVMARKRTDKEWAACVGLVSIGYWRKYECWNDLDIVNRKWPLHLRYLPHKWVTHDRNGAKLKLPWRRNCFKDWSLEKVIKPY